MRCRGQREVGAPPSPGSPTRRRRKRRQWHGEEGHGSTPQLSPGPHPLPICLTIRSAASPESLERWELLLFPKRSASLSRDFSNQDGDNNSPVTQSGQASGVPTRSHQPDHPHPFQGNPRPNLLGPRLHAWQGNTWRGRSRLAADGRRSPRSYLQTPSGLKAGGQRAEAKNKDRKNPS